MSKTHQLCAEYKLRVSTFKSLKVETVSTFNLLTVETVSTFNWLKVETVSTFKHFLYIYRQLKSKRTSLYLQYSRDEVRSKFGRKLDECVENSKIKNLRCVFGGQFF